MAKKINWSDPEEKRRYDREYQALRRLRNPEACREAVRRYKLKHPYIPVDPARKRKQMSEAAKSRWSPGGAMRKLQTQKNLAILAERERKEQERG